MVASLKFRPNEARRPLNWRWQKAGEIIDIRQRTGVPPKLRQEHGDDEVVRAAVKFRRRIDNCGNERDHCQLLDRSPNMYQAWELEEDSKDQDLKWELQARLLAQEDYDTICQKTCWPVAVIDFYEKLFFNVADRIDNPSYIVQMVMRKSIMEGLQCRDYDLLWKMYAYWGGPMVLDRMIYPFDERAKPTSRDKVATFLADGIEAAIRQKAAIAARTIPITQQNHRKSSTCTVRFWRSRKPQGKAVARRRSNGLWRL